MQHLLDTPVALAQCDRCKAYVFQCSASGLRVIVDPAPLDGMNGVRDSLIAGKAVYRKIEANGILQRLTAHAIPLVVREGAHLLADHSCGPGLVGAADVEQRQEGPPAVACDVWRAQGWQPPATCPRVGADSRTGLLFGDVVAPKSCGVCEPPPFEPTHSIVECAPLEYINRRCPNCFEMIGRTINVIGVKYDNRWVWVQHDSC